MFLCFLHHLFVGVPSSHHAVQVVGAHNPSNLLVVHTHTICGVKAHLYLSPSKLSLALYKDFLNQLVILPILGYWWSFEPFVVARLRDSSETTQSSNAQARVLGLTRLDTEVTLERF